MKSRASQLQMQLDQVANRKADQPEDYQKAVSQVKSLDAAVKKGDAQDAETALSTASTAVQNLQSLPPPFPVTAQGLDVYA